MGGNGAQMIAHSNDRGVETARYALERCLLEGLEMALQG